MTNMKRGYNRKPQHEPQHEPVQQDVHATQPGRLTRKSFTGSSSFDIDLDLIPDGMTWEWKRASLVGKEETQYQAQLQANHWQPVDASKVKGIMPSGYRGNVIVGDQMLCERPTYLCKEAAEEYQREALAQVSSQRLNSVVDHEMGDTPRSRPRLSRSIGPADE